MTGYLMAIGRIGDEIAHGAPVPHHARIAAELAAREQSYLFSCG